MAANAKSSSKLNNNTLPVSGSAGHNKSRITLSASSTSTNKSGKQKRVTLGDGPEEKEGHLAFQVLTQQHTQELLPLDVDDVEAKLCEIFQLTDRVNDLRQASTLDYYTGAVWWAKEQKFTEQQTSGFFTLAHALLENIKEKHMPQAENLLELKKYMIGVGGIESADAVSGGLEFFNVKQGKDIIHYIHSCLFTHYKLYEFLFTHNQAEEIIGTDLEIEAPQPASLPFPPPLNEGLTEEKFQSYLITPPPSPPPEESDASPTEESGVQPQAVSEEDLNMFSQLSTDDIKEVIQSVMKEMFENLETDVANKLRDKENQIMNKLNKLQKFAE